MKTLSLLMATAVAFTSISCKNANDKKESQTIVKQNEKTAETPITKIETAHHKNSFLSKNAVEFDINVKFGGKEHISGKITALTNSTKALITLKTGDKIYINNDKVQHTPNIKNEPMVRFDAYTWTYFFMFPYKLSDAGTQWSEFGETTLNGETKNIQHLTFESGTGDAPDDWYYVYSNPKTNLIDVAAYIVSFGKTKEQAEKEPHAIKYENYQTVDGIPFATNWTFWGWTKKQGLTQQIGEASIENIKFLEADDQYFKAPKDYISK
ncbi:DUF6503 family protein [Wenyingzhuangia sp. IMCC45533]